MPTAHLQFAPIATDFTQYDTSLLLCLTTVFRGAHNADYGEFNDCWITLQMFNDPDPRIESASMAMFLARSRTLHQVRANRQALAANAPLVQGTSVSIAPACEMISTLAQEMSSLWPRDQISPPQLHLSRFLLPSEDPFFTKFPQELRDMVYNHLDPVSRSADGMRYACRAGNREVNKAATAFFKHSGVRMNKNGGLYGKKMNWTHVLPPPALRLGPVRSLTLTIALDSATMGASELSNLHLAPSNSGLLLADHEKLRNILKFDLEHLKIKLDVTRPTAELMFPAAWMLVRLREACDVGDEVNVNTVEVAWSVPPPAASIRKRLPKFDILLARMSEQYHGFWEAYELITGQFHHLRDPAQTFMVLKQALGSTSLKVQLSHSLQDGSIQVSSPTKWRSCLEHIDRLPSRRPSRLEGGFIEHFAAVAMTVLFRRGLEGLIRYFDEDIVTHRRRQNC
ncbi:hypothetical protein NX059_012419 [Plenodomus lindquistii]|nr:hypothetical protein NX059_012419 [Plenodomus lindquistii]